LDRLRVGALLVLGLGAAQPIESAPLGQVGPPKSALEPPLPVSVQQSAEVDCGLGTRFALKWSYAGKANKIASISLGGRAGSKAEMGKINQWLVAFNKPLTVKVYCSKEGASLTFVPFEPVAAEKAHTATVYWINNEAVLQAVY
jgi:hypothetical protein